VSFIEGSARDQVSLLPSCVDDYVASDALVRVVDAFVASMNLAELGFGRAVMRSRMFGPQVLTSAPL
jgi:transposase